MARADHRRRHYGRFSRTDRPGLFPGMNRLSGKSVGRGRVKSAQGILSFAPKHGPLPAMVGSTEMSLRLLAGKRILVFEDGFLLSDEAGSRLAAIGAAVLGPVHTAQHALDHVESGGVDAVVLDVGLEPETVLPLIAELEEKSIPFVFALAANPRLDTKRFAGFVLSDDDRDLGTIAEALFLRRGTEH